MTYRTAAPGPKFRWACAHDTARDFAAYMLAEYGLVVDVPERVAGEGSQHEVTITAGAMTLIAAHSGQVGEDLPGGKWCRWWSRSEGAAAGGLIAGLVREL